MPLPSELPIAAYKTDLQEAVATYPVLLVIGETGSGKTTQLPQYLWELLSVSEAAPAGSGTGATAVGEATAAAVEGTGPPAEAPAETVAVTAAAPAAAPAPAAAAAPVALAPPPRETMGRIAVTQPRRLAAISVAARVAQEVGCTLGGLVGYTIRFEDMSSPQTHIKYMTDGILVRECMEDPLLRRYAVVILDEAHERSLETDILFCLLKRAVHARPDLKLVIMSATLDAGRFSAYFDNCPVFMIPGRAFEVEVYHNSDMDVSDLRAKYVQYAFDTVMYIHKADILGDVLVFLTGPFRGLRESGPLLSRGSWRTASRLSTGPVS